MLAYTGQAPRVLEGFGFGAALLAMFMRVGGGIFTKAADVGADLVGKVEQNIPEDDPRNAATIADNVGDNVGDCAGMAADLFESYAVTLVAALILGTAAFGLQGLLFPLIVPAIGVVTAILGVYLTKAREGENTLIAINRSFYLSAVFAGVLSIVAAYVYLPGSFSDLTGPSDNSVATLAGDPRLIASVAVVIGIVLASVILKLTGYYTGTEDAPVKDVGKASLTGSATVILAGISVGFESAVYTAIVIAAAVYGAFLLSGSIVVALFAVALAGTGLLTTVGVIVAMDTFGPVSDNAQGIAEMSGDVEGEGVEILTELDAVGNTTKAITKGIAIATAVLAATALFGSYRDAINQALVGVDADRIGSAFRFEVFSPNTLVGVVLGAAAVFMFSGLAINAVSRAAGVVVGEVRRQFREIPGIMSYGQKKEDGTTEKNGRPEYQRVVDICTRDSLRELATPGLLAILAPVAVGFGLGVGPLAGYLAGAIAAGTLMAIFLANSGGAWDNAKKLVEDGNHGGKGSDAHEATIIGDTVGDPFKDTAGPSINPLIKVMNLVSLLIAPAIVALSVGDVVAGDPDRHRGGRGADHRGRDHRVQAAHDRDRGHPGGDAGRLVRTARHATTAAHPDRGWAAVVSVRIGSDPPERAGSSGGGSHEPSVTGAPRPGGPRPRTGVRRGGRLRWHRPSRPSSGPTRCAGRCSRSSGPPPLPRRGERIRPRPPGRSAATSDAP